MPNSSPPWTWRDRSGRCFLPFISLSPWWPVGFSRLFLFHSKLDRFLCYENTARYFNSLMILACSWAIISSKPKKSPSRALQNRQNNWHSSKLRLEKAWNLNMSSQTGWNGQKNFTIRLQRHSTENSKQIFPEKVLCGLNLFEGEMGGGSSVFGEYLSNILIHCSCYSFNRFDIWNIRKTMLKRSSFPYCTVMAWQWREMFLC